jgi:hypothetical protein
MPPFDRNNFFGVALAKPVPTDPDQCNFNKYFHKIKNINYKLNQLTLIILLMDEKNFLKKRK